MRLRFFRKIMEAKSAANAVSEELGAVDLANVNELTFYIVFGAGTASGAVQIESAPVAGYTGTWAAEGSPVSWSAADKAHKVSIAGASYVSRARISTIIAGGTVDVYAIANG